MALVYVKGLVLNKVCTWTAEVVLVYKHTAVMTNDDNVFNKALSHTL